MQLTEIYNLVAAELQEVGKLFERELFSDEPMISRMIGQAQDGSGKMLRPLLVFLSGRACGSISQKHIVIATVAEMVHAATLVHDDVLDEAQYRRGHPTINQLYGNESAVLLGDLLISHAFGLCSKIDSNAVSRRFSETTNTVCEGELMQLYHRGDYELSEESYFEIITRKTASLMGTCCYLGAEASGADRKTCEAMEMFGRNLGVAFQIMDDIADITSDEAVMGKTLGTDMLKEKMTLPCIHYLSHCGREDSDWTRKLLSQKNKQKNELLVVKLHEAGSIEYACHRAAEYVDRADKALPQTVRQETKEVLLELASNIVSCGADKTC